MENNEISQRTINFFIAVFKIHQVPPLLFTKLQLSSILCIASPEICDLTEKIAYQMKPELVFYSRTQSIWHPNSVTDSVVLSFFDHEGKKVSVTEDVAGM